MVVNKKEMVKSLIQAYFNILLKAWEESGKVPSETKESKIYNEYTEELVDFFLASVGLAWKTESILQDNFVEGPDCSLIINFYSELRKREVDWDEVWDRLIQLIEVQAELGELEEV